MSYNDVFLCIKDFWWNFIFETLDNKKNNQKKIKSNMGSQCCIFVYQAWTKLVNPKIDISLFKINCI